MHALCSYGVAQLSLAGSVPGAQFGGAGLRQIWPSLALCASNLMPMESSAEHTNALECILACNPAELCAESGLSWAR